MVQSLLNPMSTTASAASGSQNPPFVERLLLPAVRMGTQHRFPAVSCTAGCSQSCTEQELRYPPWRDEDLLAQNRNGGVEGYRQGAVLLLSPTSSAGHSELPCTSVSRCTGRHCSETINLNLDHLNSSALAQESAGHGPSTLPQLLQGHNVSTSKVHKSLLWSMQSHATLKPECLKQYFPLQKLPPMALYQLQKVTVVSSPTQFQLFELTLCAPCMFSLLTCQVPSLLSNQRCKQLQSVKCHLQSTLYSQS